MPRRRGRRRRRNINLSEITHQESDQSAQDIFVDESLSKKRKTVSNSEMVNKVCTPQTENMDPSVCLSSKPPSLVLTLNSSDCNDKSDPVPPLSPSSRKSLDSLLSLSGTCKEHLMRVVSTAIQFQRHSHHPKLCSSHFNKALALENLSCESDDSDEFEDLNHSEPVSENISDE